MAILKMTQQVKRNAPLAFVQHHRDEMAEIARHHLRVAKTTLGVRDRTIELLSEWAAGFVS